MSPKSLLRHPEVVSPIRDFTSERFKEIIDDELVDKKKARRVLLCSGKIYYDLLHEQKKGEHTDVAIIRIEQLYPFPQKQLLRLLKNYADAEVVWVQEEPENMGAWYFLFRYMKDQIHWGIYRKPSASPATGFSKIHHEEQEVLIKKAFEKK
jgi:2-oxoglutarate dehydrogenase E1 component